MKREITSSAKRSETPGRSDTSLVPAVEQAARILLFFTKSESGKANLTEICRVLNIYKSRGHAILKTLAAYGLIERDEATKRYSLGPALITLSHHLLRHLNIREKALPHLEALAVETRGTALLGITAGDYLIVAAKKNGISHLGITIETGHRFHLSAGAHGKAIVTFLPEEERARILKRKRLYFHGSPDRLDRKRLNEEMATCRERGYALDMGDLQPGIHAASSPVFDGNNQIVGALIAVGTFPEGKARTIGEKTRAAAMALSRAMGASIAIGGTYA